MLAAEDLLRVLETIPLGYKSPDDEFFTAANKALLQPYKKLGVISDYEENEAAVSAVVNTIFCNVAGCCLAFDTVSAYQTHYNSLHRYICNECHRALPTAHLLDLHLSEQHDSYFAARVARGDAMYACLLEDCSELMLTQEARKEHCIDAHSFPSDYRFERVAGHQPQSSRKKQTNNPPKNDGAESAVEPMEVNADSVAKSSLELKPKKTFTFGLQKEKTFQFKKPQKATKIDVKELQEALDDIDI